MLHRSFSHLLPATRAANELTMMMMLIIYIVVVMMDVHGMYMRISDFILFFYLPKDRHGNKYMYMDDAV